MALYTKLKFWLSSIFMMNYVHWNSSFHSIFLFFFACDDLMRKAFGPPKSWWSFWPFASESTSQQLRIFIDYLFLPQNGVHFYPISSPLTLKRMVFEYQVFFLKKKRIWISSCKMKWFSLTKLFISRWTLKFICTDANEYLNIV